MTEATIEGKDQENPNSSSADPSIDSVNDQLQTKFESLDLSRAKQELENDLLKESRHNSIQSESSSVKSAQEMNLLKDQGQSQSLDPNPVGLPNSTRTPSENGSSQMQPTPKTAFMPFTPNQHANMRPMPYNMTMIRPIPSPSPPPMNVHPRPYAPQQGIPVPPPYQEYTAGYPQMQAYGRPSVTYQYVNTLTRPGSNPHVIPRPPLYPAGYHATHQRYYRPVQYAQPAGGYQYGRPLPRPPVQYVQAGIPRPYMPVHAAPSDAGSVSSVSTALTASTVATSNAMTTASNAGDNPALQTEKRNSAEITTPKSSENNANAINTNGTGNPSHVSTYMTTAESAAGSTTSSVDYQSSFNSSTHTAQVQGYNQNQTAQYYYYNGNQNGVSHMASYSSLRSMNYVHQQQLPQQTRDSDTASVISSTAESALRVQAFSQVVKEDSNESLETLRQAVKKSNDPKMQLDFAKQVIKAAENFLVKNPQMDQKKAKRTQDLLQAEALKYIKKASGGMGIGKQGIPDAIFLLADCYGNGALGLSIDHDKAFSLYVQASKQSHPAGTYRAAVCCEVGAGTRRDAARAAQLYRKAAALGDTAAMYKLGMILLGGSLGQAKNPREGVTWLKRAASQADSNTPHALHELGLLYEGKVAELGNVVIPDPAYAYDLFVRSAHLGYSPSQYKLGLCYEYGHLNLPVDPKRSIGWYTKAAQQGDPEAELALSGWYLTGSEGLLQQSDQEAYLWARKAADKGLAKAEYAVGYFAEHGVGVRQDVEEARKWYMRAAGQGNKRAIARLNELSYGAASPVKHYAAKNFRSEADARNGECSVM